MNKIIYFVVFSLIGALGYGWWANRQIIITHQNEQIAAFVAKGGRFTAKDGQALCERVAVLERLAGQLHLPCEYDK